MNPLKLIALDQDDIAVVSTHLQDAVVKVADIVWLPAENRLVMGVNRFDWEACGCEDPCYKRRRTALRFERVMSLRCRNVRPADKDSVLNLLAVECLECELADLGPTWDAKARPVHQVDSISPQG